MFRFVLYILTGLFGLIAVAANAQVLPADTAVRLRVKQSADSVAKRLNKLPDSLGNLVKERLHHTVAAITAPVLPDVKNPLQLLPLQHKPAGRFMAVTGGYTAYNVTFRGSVDTPFAERNVYQHNLTGQLSVVAAGVPLHVSYLLRRTNSAYFQQLTDVQVSFDANQYRNNILQAAKQRLLASTAALKDPLLEMEFNLQQQLADEAGGWLRDPLNRQRLVEAYEIVDMPALEGADSIANATTDSLKKTAADYIKWYKVKQQAYESYRAKADSTAKLYRQMLNKLQQCQTLIQQGFSGFADTEKLQEALRQFGLTEKVVPQRLRWLMGIKRLAVGRSLLNQSPLTAQNLNITGINVAYNYKKWYAAAAAGTVDYRFRDFVASRVNRTPQYVYTARVGAGTEEGTHFFVSAFRGQKQLFTVTNVQRQPTSMVITGVSLELKYRITRHHYIVAEVAESVSPDFRNNPVTNQKFNLNDRNNKAFSVQFSSTFPSTRSSIEGMYRFTGANYQSFSNFQTNAATKVWRIKLEQYFFKRALKIVAGARSNVFEHPFLVQSYQSNTVLKSLQASFRKRRWPTITAGYMPTTQLTRLDNLVLENQFNSLNASLLHRYHWLDKPLTTSVVYSRFYNTAADTGFAYFNAANLFINQTVNFTHYSMQVAISHSKSSSFELNVLDGGFSLNAGRAGSCTFGVKVSNFNRAETVSSIYTKLQLNLRKWGSLQLLYDNGYLPGANRKFVKNTIFNMGYSRSW